MFRLYYIHVGLEVVKTSYSHVECVESKSVQGS